MNKRQMQKLKPFPYVKLPALNVKHYTVTRIRCDTLAPLLLTFNVRLNLFRNNVSSVCIGMKSFLLINCFVTWCDYCSDV